MDSKTVEQKAALCAERVFKNLEFLEQEIKDISYNHDKEQTVITLANGNKMGWCGKKARQKFTEITEKLGL